MLDIEVIGIDAVAPGDSTGDPARPTGVELEELCALALSSAGIDEGHVAIEFVDEDRMRELNLEHRQIDEPTDVLSFGIDEDDWHRLEEGDVVTARVGRRLGYIHGVEVTAPFRHRGGAAAGPVASTPVACVVQGRSSSSSGLE